MFNLGRILARSSISQLGKLHIVKATSAGPRFYSSAHEETDAEFDQRMLSFFKRKDIDGWWVRKGLQELHGADLVPEPEIIIEALHAIRRLNDLALAIRFLESVKRKCGNRQAEIWPYILGEIRPTLTQLGIPTPEELGYDKPELALKDPFLE